MIELAVGCRARLERSWTLPAVLFSDPEWYDAERRTLFHGGWVAVARSSELSESNRFVTATIGDEPVVVLRGRDGQLRALSNVCRHRNAVMLTGSGSAPSLQCPYHRWTYRHDGSLASAPNMEQSEAFDATTLCLPTLAVDEWHGWVLVNIDSTAEPLAETVPSLDELMTEHRVAEVGPLGRWTIPHRGTGKSLLRISWSPITIAVSTPKRSSRGRRGRSRSPVSLGPSPGRPSTTSVSSMARSRSSRS